MPEDHPARDMQDTFYVDGQSENGDKLVMRTHTSPGQIRFMQMHKPPFAIIIPGRTFRNEATDATHEHTFTQMEGLVVGKNISYANMIWTLRHALQQFFGDDVQTKLLPSYFPFVEPGAEMAMSSPKFKGGKWVEVLGCGMVNQKVFEAAGYPAGEYQGFAFGLGITRFALMKYGIPDIRLLAENDMRFLRQF
jgi:phenylalanyl-tRNA synthetase alpha chain